MRIDPRTALLALTFAAALPLAAACAPEPEPAPPPEPATAVPAEPAAGTAIAPDGVEIAYEARGAGDVAVVFLHCWACNRDFWRHQVEPVAEAGYRVVALDLPGHGASAAAARAEWTLPGLAADVEAVIRELGLERVVLVGHSMGGPVGLETAGRMPGTVAGIVGVDTLHDAEFVFPEGMVESLTAQLTADYRAGIEGFLPQLFKPDADPEIVKWVVDQAVDTANHETTIAMMAAFPKWDPPRALAAAGVPVRCINAAPGEAGMPTAVETNRKYADFDAVLMEGVGHYPQLERPEEFNRLLLAYLAELSAPAVDAGGAAADAG
jgi:pimeloyl-ACP methyl ester carboxylesterase